MKTIYTYIWLAILLAPQLAFGQSIQYEPLTTIPGISVNNITLLGYLNALITLVTTLVGIYAVVQITLIGFAFITSDLTPLKRAGLKKDLFGVLSGLAILLSAFVILRTINPNLVNLNVLENISDFSAHFSTLPPSFEKIQEAAFTVCIPHTALRGEEIDQAKILDALSQQGDPATQQAQADLESHCDSNNGEFIVYRPGDACTRDTSDLETGADTSLDGHKWVGICLKRVLTEEATSTGGGQLGVPSSEELLGVPETQPTL